jgi:hypothetical protein
MGACQSLPATMMPTALPVSYARLMIAVTAATWGLGTPTMNPYKSGPVDCPGGGTKVPTGESEAAVIVTGVPAGR